MGLFKTNQAAALDALTAELGKVQEAVSRETSKLADLKSKLADAERALSNTLANEVISGDAGAVQKAQTHVTEARATVEQQTVRLRAVRGRLWTAGATAATEAAGVKPDTLAAEAEGAATEFASEWASAARNWAAVLARRRQIERLLFRPLQLPDPTPSGEPVVDDVMPVHSGLTSLLHRLSAAGGIDTQSVTVQDDEVPLRRSFLDALQKFEAVERLRHSRARHEALQAEGR